MSSDTPRRVAPVLPKISRPEREALRRRGSRLPRILNTLLRGARGGASDDPLRVRVLLSQLPDATKVEVCRALATADKDGNYPEYVEALLRLPTRRHPAPAGTLGQNLQRARECLESACAGQAELKDVLLQVTSERLCGARCPTIVGIQGPAGNGKTTLVRRGLARAVDAPFFTVALGGLSDATHLIGTERSYHNSTYGRLARIAMEAECTNPVIFWDEVDKVAGDTRGQEILDLLVHLTDPNGCDAVRDKFLGNVDLSGATMVFAFNDAAAVPPVLLNRMRVVETRGYSDEEKAGIARTHLVPSVYAELGTTAARVDISDEFVSAAVARCKGESGVRGLRQVLKSAVQRSLTACATRGSVRLGVPEACTRRVRTSAGAEDMVVFLDGPEAEAMLRTLAPDGASGTKPPPAMYT